MVCRARPSLQRVVSSPGKRIQQLKQDTQQKRDLYAKRVQTIGQRMDRPRTWMTGNGA